MPVSDNGWLCFVCRSDAFPFFALDSYELAELAYSSNISCLFSRTTVNNKFESLPCFDLMCSISKHPNLSRIDSDLHLPLTSNFDYYSTHDFHSSEAINSSLAKSFSALHLNTRSLAANFNSFCLVLQDLNHLFPVIALTETKIKQGSDPFVNTSLPSYHFLSQPSLSNSGGVGFFVKDNLSYTLRQDLCKNAQNEFESLWIEIEVPHEKNILCGVIYRHPNSKLNITTIFI